VSFFVWFPGEGTSDPKVCSLKDLQSHWKQLEGIGDDDSLAPLFEEDYEFKEKGVR
jgi:hypothetical protein